MIPALTISQAQLAALARPPQQRHRAQLVRAMEQQWLHHYAAWQPGPAEPALANRTGFFGQVYTWAVAAELADWSGLALAGALLLRARCAGWPPEDSELALRYLEDAPDPDPVLDWLTYCFDQ